jgi:hypothetical protein
MPRALLSAGATSSAAWTLSPLGTERLGEWHDIDRSEIDP